MREAAVRAAEDVIMDSAFVRMSRSGFAAFMAAVDAPGRPVPALVDVFRRKAPWENGRGRK